MKTAEEKQPQKRRYQHHAKLVPFARQEIIMLHAGKKVKLKSDAETHAYEAGRAEAEILRDKIFTADLVVPSCIAAEEVLETVYQSIEDCHTDLATANRMRAAMEEALRQRQASMLKSLKQSSRKKRR